MCIIGSVLLACVHSLCVFKLVFLQVVQGFCDFIAGSICVQEAALSNNCKVEHKKRQLISFFLSVRWSIKIEQARHGTSCGEVHKQNWRCKHDTKNFLALISFKSVLLRHYTLLIWLWDNCNEAGCFQWKQVGNEDVEDLKRELIGANYEVAEWS